MSHALIIADNMIVGRAIQDRLAAMGFTSFDHVWTEEQAIAAADRRSPQLVVVGDAVESGCALSAARIVSLDGKIPVLLVTANAFRARKHLYDSDRASGPFLLDEIEMALSLARATI
jgi:two-component system, response regulator PdtaR